MTVNALNSMNNIDNLHSLIIIRCMLRIKLLELILFGFWWVDLLGDKLQFSSEKVPIIRNVELLVYTSDTIPGSAYASHNDTFVYSTKRISCLVSIIEKIPLNVEKWHFNDEWRENLTNDRHEWWRESERGIWDIPMYVWR